jgi:hypothetical protein
MPIKAYEVTELGGTPEQEAYMRDIIDQFTVDATYLGQIRDHFITEMDKGLNNEGATLAMIPSYVEGRLTGIPFCLFDLEIIFLFIVFFFFSSYQAKKKVISLLLIWVEPTLEWCL